MRQLPRDPAHPLRLRDLPGNVILPLRQGVAHTWRDAEKGNGDRAIYAVNPAGEEIDRELTRDQMRYQRRREEMEQFRKSQAA